MKLKKSGSLSLASGYREENKKEEDKNVMV